MANKTKKPEREVGPTPELLSSAAMNPYSNHNSGSRQVMSSGQIGQTLVTHNTTEKLVQTGVDKEFGKYTFNIKFDCDAKILKVIPRYNSVIGKDSLPKTELTVLYEDMGTGKIGHLIVPRHISHHSHFGYELKPNEILDELVPGKEVPKGTILSDSPNVKENGGYALGTNLNAVLTSDHYGSEDGIKISESGLKKMSFDVFETRVFNIDSNNIGLNLYGDDDDYKMFPDIGEDVRSDQVLMAKRNLINPRTNTVGLDDIPLLLNRASLQKLDTTFDKPVYLKYKGTVYDIKVFKKVGAINPLFPYAATQLDKYAAGLKDYYSALIEFETELRSNSRKKFGKDYISLKPALHSLLVDARINTFTGATYKDAKKIRWSYKKDSIMEYRVEIVIKSTVVPVDGFKMTDTHAGKGVVVKVVPDDHMPIDHTGMRAEISFDSGATLARMNLGRVFEQFDNRLSIDTKKAVCLMFGVDGVKDIKRIREAVLNSPKELIINAHEHIMGLFDIIAKTQAKEYRQMTFDDKVEYLIAVMSTELYIFKKVGEEKNQTKTCQDIQKSKYALDVRPVELTSETGKKGMSLNDILISPLHIYLLEKTTDTWLAVASSKVQTHGLLAGPSKSDKTDTPYNLNPQKSLGETEIRVIESYGGPELLAELLDRNTSLETHSDIYRSILEAGEKSSDIDNLVDRNVNPYGGNRPLGIFNSMLNGVGLKTQYVNDKGEKNA